MPSWTGSSRSRPWSSKVPNIQRSVWGSLPPVEANLSPFHADFVELLALARHTESKPPASALRDGSVEVPSAEVDAAIEELDAMLGDRREPWRGTCHFPRVPLQYQHQTEMHNRLDNANLQCLAAPAVRSRLELGESDMLEKEGVAQKDRILVVDNEPHLLRSVSRLLGGAGYKVVEAATGQEALRVARETKPDLVLVDVELPDMDGFELCGRIKANAELANTFVVLLSGRAIDVDSQAEAMDGRPDGYVLRSISERELLARVGTMVRLKRTEDALRERTHQLGKRVKELKCLYSISELVETPGITLEEVLQRTVDLVRAAWQYPEITCARIILEDQEFKTDSFEATAWRQVCVVRIKGSPVGQIEVCYLQERPEADEGPFLEEERRLLNSIAEQLGKVAERLQTEAALRESEERFRQLAENVEVAFWLGTPEVGDERQVLYVNPAFEEIFGIAAEEIYRSDRAWLKAVHEEDRGRTLSALEEFLQDRGDYDIEYRIVRNDGAIRWIWARGFPIRDEQGQIYRTSGLVQDVTERVRAEEAQRQSERELSIRNQINSIFLIYPDEEMYWEVLQLILSLMNSEYGTFGYFDEHGSFVAPALTREIFWDKCNVPEKEIIFRKGTFGGIWGRAIEERTTLIANVGPFHMPPGHIQIENTMVTPIIYRDRVISAIHLSNKPGGYDEQDRAMVEMIAAKIAPVLYARVQRDRRDKARERAEEALRESEQRYRSLFEQTLIGIVSSDRDGRLSAANPAAVEILSYGSQGELVGRPAELIWLDQKAWSNAVGVIRELGYLPVREVRLRRKDGTPVYALATAIVDQDKDSNSLGITATFTDITDRKQAEGELQWELAVDAALSTLYPPLVSPHSSIREIADSVLEQARGLTGSVHGYVSAIDPVTGDNVGHTLTEMLEGNCQVTGEDRRIAFPCGADGRYAGLWGHSLNTGEAFFTNAPETHPASQGAPEGHVPVQQFLSVPVLLGEELVGQISLGNPGRDYTERDLQAIQRIAEFYALAIQRKRVEEALRDSEEKYRKLVEEISDVIYTLDTGGVVTYVSPAVESLLGYCPSEVMGRPFAQFVAPEDLEQSGTRFRQLTSSEAPGLNEYRVVTKAGDVRWLRVSSQPIAKGNQVAGVRGVLTDVTDRKQAQEQLAEAVAAAERERLARDLHDAVTQTLFSVAVIAEALPRVWERDPDEARHGLEELRWQTQGALAEMRTMLLELRPAALTEQELGTLLRQLADGMMGRTRMPVTVSVVGECTLPDEVQIALYRIAQEALNNTIKHALASQASISLRCEPERVALCIKDNGRGFDLATQPHQFGLNVMRERVQGIGATLKIESRPGQGTEVAIDWRKPEEGKDDGGTEPYSGDDG
jgi:PAS domain S-box-containing protein